MPVSSTKELPETLDGAESTCSRSTRQASQQRTLFPFMLLASGFCGISYEILYGRILGNLIGDQFIVSASILLTFLLGIGLGGYFAHRLWAHLWLLEAGIGVYGALFAVSSGLLDALLYSDLPLARSGLERQTKSLLQRILEIEG